MALVTTGSTESGAFMIDRTSCRSETEDQFDKQSQGQKHA
jgi:hypothetical protein